MLIHFVKCSTPMANVIMLAPAMQSVPGRNTGSCNPLPAWRRLLWLDLGAACQATERQVPQQPLLAPASFSFAVCPEITVLTIHSIKAHNCDHAQTCCGLQEASCSSFTVMIWLCQISCDHFQCVMAHIALYVMKGSWGCCCRYRVTAFDLRGHGFTETSQDEDLSAETLVQVYNTLNVAVSQRQTCLALAKHVLCCLHSSMHVMPRHCCLGFKLLSGQLFLCKPGDHSGIIQCVWHSVRCHSLLNTSTAKHLQS